MTIPIRPPAVPATVEQDPWRDAQPCRFCGDSRLGLDYHWYFSERRDEEGSRVQVDMIGVSCSRCGARGPMVEDPPNTDVRDLLPTIIALWNGAATPPPWPD